MSAGSTECAMRDAVYALAECVLPPEQAAEASRHVESCRECRDAFETALELQTISRSLGTARLNSRDHQRIDRCTTVALEALRQSAAEPKG